MHLRFVHTRNLSGMAARQGFQQTAYAPKNCADLDLFTRLELETLIDWIKENLAIPDQFSRDKTKGKDHHDARRSSWFKTTARTPVAKAFELSNLLERKSYPIKALKSSRIV